MQKIIQVLLSRSSSSPWLPDFFLIQHTKTGKIYQITVKYIKWPQNRPNGHKIYQMDQYITTSSITRPSQIYQNRESWFENMPSGNPVSDLLGVGDSLGEREEQEDGGEDGEAGAEVDAVEQGEG
jgi:hypothetical protein